MDMDPVQCENLKDATSPEKYACEVVQICDFFVSEDGTAFGTNWMNIVQLSLMAATFLVAAPIAYTMRHPKIIKYHQNRMICIIITTITALC